MADPHQEYQDLIASVADRPLVGAEKWLFKQRQKTLLDRMAKERAGDREQYHHGGGSDQVAFAAEQATEPVEAAERDRLLAYMPAGRDFLRNRAKLAATPAAGGQGGESGLSRDELDRYIGLTPEGQSLIREREKERRRLAGIPTH